MDWEFFERLSQEDAKKFLENFLSVESENIKIIIKQAQKENVSADFSIASVEPLFRWGSIKMGTISKEPDGTLPDWIRSSSSYLENLFDFDRPSKKLLLGLAFYLGEAFVRTYSTLSWSIGDRETAEQNMPVVTGFKNKIEMAPMLVSENIIGRVMAEPERIQDIKLMIESWENDVKS